jgi:hypothetical protein
MNSIGPRVIVFTKAFGDIDRRQRHTSLYFVKVINDKNETAQCYKILFTGTAGVPPAKAPSDATTAVAMSSLRGSDAPDGARSGRDARGPSEEMIYQV